MIILLPHELVLLHASEPFLASYGFLYSVYSKQNWHIQYVNIAYKNTFKRFSFVYMLCKYRSCE